MRLTSRERVEGAIHLLGDGEVLRADVQGPCTLDLRLGGEIPRWRSNVERSCSKLCSNGADFADVRERSPVSRSLVALRIRSLANGGEHAAEDWGSRGRRFKSCHPDGKQQVSTGEPLRRLAVAREDSVCVRLCVWSGHRPGSGGRWLCSFRSDPESSVVPVSL